MIDYADKAWLQVGRVEINTPCNAFIFFACIGLLIAGIPLIAVNVED